jgi:quercetin dioxygenase-like cupin family protein
MTLLLSRAFALTLAASALQLAAAAADSGPAPKPAAVPAGRPARYTIDNCISTFNPAKVEKTGAGGQFWFFDRDFAEGKTLKLSVVGPHLATHAPHRHVEDEFFFILEGQAECYLDGQWRAVPPNTGFYCPSGQEHGIRNAGDTEMRYLVIKKYEGAVPPAAPAVATPAH